MIYIAQFFSALLAALVITKSFVDFRRGKESPVVFFFWLITWAVIVALAFFPTLVDRINNVLGGTSSGLGRVFGMALAFLLFIIYRIYKKTDRIERQLAQLIRTGALRDLGKK